jgi:cob(I)alamin adenosyltransferase
VNGTGLVSTEFPNYWQNEISGVLRPAVEAYLDGRAMTQEQIATLRAYIRQWIGASVWELNPFAKPDYFAWLAGMRDACDALDSLEAIARWLERAAEKEIDPL